MHATVSHIVPGGYFGDDRFSSRKTYIWPQGPPKSAHFFFSLVVLGGQKSPKWRSGGRRVGPIDFFGGPFGAFWALRGPKSRFFEISGGTLNATVSHIVPGGPRGAPEGLQGSYFRAILVVSGWISEPFWGSTSRFCIYVLTN